MMFKRPVRYKYSVNMTCPCGTSLNIPVDVYDPAYVAELESKVKELTKALEAYREEIPSAIPLLTKFPTSKKTKSGS